MGTGTLKIPFGIVFIFYLYVKKILNSSHFLPAANILPSAAFCHIFYSSSAYKKALSATKNIGFYHVLNERVRSRNVSQQKSVI
jgi:hypothetical protein